MKGMNSTRAAEALSGVLSNREVTVEERDGALVLSYPTRIAKTVVKSLQEMQEVLNAVVPPTHSPEWTVRLRAAHDEVIFADEVDPLGEPVDLPEIQRRPVLEEGVIIGVTESGDPLRIPLMGGAQTLVTGATGAGKGSVLWGIVRGLWDLVEAGLVRLWIADPKGGQEFGEFADVAYRFAADDEQTLVLLREACEMLTAKARWMSMNVGRSLTSDALTVEAPLDLIIVDELAALTDHPTAKVRAETLALTSKILRQGRSAGVTLVAATQDPRTRVLPNRAAYTHRVALRLNEASETTMVLGAGARAQGALADLISHDLPGVLYVVEDGRAGFLRGRAAFVPSEEIQSMREAVLRARTSRTQASRDTAWRSRGLFTALRTRQFGG